MPLLLLTSLFCLSFAHHFNHQFTRKTPLFSQNYNTVTKNHPSHSINHHLSNFKDISKGGRNHFGKHFNHHTHNKHHHHFDDSDIPDPEIHPIDPNNKPPCPNDHPLDQDKFPHDPFPEDHDQEERYTNTNEFLETICKYASFDMCSGCQILPMCQYTKNSECVYVNDRTYFDESNGLFGICETNDITYYFIVMGVVVFCLSVLLCLIIYKCCCSKRHRRHPRRRPLEVEMNPNYGRIPPPSYYFQPNTPLNYIPIATQPPTYTPPTYVV
ncbi:hypothetical protein QTN25_006639 [Entamoeba marina]